MADIYLHDHPDFADLIRIVAADKSIDPVLVEKDYWIMHALFGLQQIGLLFELKGGTSLSKGYGIIARFSEDIDIRIEPPKDMGVKTGPNHNKPAHCHSRKSYYDWLAQTITIAGIQSVSRDCEFDDLKYRGGACGFITQRQPARWTALKRGSCWSLVSTLLPRILPPQSAPGHMTTPQAWLISGTIVRMM